jgi:hypothetical protein
MNKDKVKNYNECSSIPSPGYRPRGNTKPRQQGGASSFSFLNPMITCKAQALVHTCFPFSSHSKCVEEGSQHGKSHCHPES